MADKEVAEKICLNCAEWGGDKGSDKGDCYENDSITHGHDTCHDFSIDGSRFCTICNSTAKEADHSSMTCTKNSSHVASQWDYEWVDFSAEEVR